MFSIPVPLMSLLALVTAAAFSVVSLAIWIFPANQVITGAVSLLLRLLRHPASLALPLLLLGPVLYLLRHTEWQGYHPLGFALLLAGLIMYLANPLAWRSMRLRQLTIMAAIVTVIGLGLRVGFLLFDWVWTDEGFYLSTATNMLTRLQVAPAAMRLPEDIPIYPLFGYGIGIYGLWARLVGVSLTKARLLSYLLGLISLPFIYLTVRRWYGQRSAVLTVGIASLNILFQQSTYARGDALPLAVTSLTLFAHVFACGQNKLRYHFIVGLLAALALDAHLISLAFLFSYGGYYLIDAVNQFRAHKRFTLRVPLWPYLLGASIGLAFYGFGHILAVSQGQFTSNNQGIFDYLEVIFSQRVPFIAMRYRTIWGFSSPDVLLIVGAAGAALIRRTEADRHWLILMGLTQVAYWLFAPNAEIHYVIAGLPIYIASTGALFVYGLKRSESKELAPHYRTAYLILVVVMIAQSLGTLLFRNQNRVAWLDIRQPMVETLRERVPTDAAIMGPGFLYVYVVEYQNYLNIHHPEVDMGAELTGADTEAYWRDILLEEWPVAQLDPREFTQHWLQIEVARSYMAARHAEEVVPDLYLVPQQRLMVVPDLTRSAPLPELQLAAYEPFPASLAAGDSALIHTIWVTRDDIDQTYWATLSLRDEEGQSTIVMEHQIESGWAGTRTDEWSANEFHDIAFPISIPTNLPAGRYLLHLTLHLASQSSTVMECEPKCELVIDILQIARP